MRYLSSKNRNAAGSLYQNGLSGLQVANVHQ